MAIPSGAAPHTSALPHGAERRLRRAQVVASTSMSAARAVLALLVLLGLGMVLADALQSGAAKVSQEVSASPLAPPVH